MVVPIVKGKGDIRIRSYGAVMLLEHGMNMVERVLEKGFAE